MQEDGRGRMELESRSGEPDQGRARIKFDAGKIAGRGEGACLLVVADTEPVFESLKRKVDIFGGF